jgi:hypothetical protein
MPRARKLFPIYGSTLANHMLTAIARDGVVDRFVAGYIAEYDRRGILGGPGRERELAETVGREILLAMIMEVQAALPSFYGKKPKDKLKSEEADAIDAFFRELLAALARAQNWKGEDRQQFNRDLGLYSDFKVRRELGASTRKKEKLPEEEAPFVARVALLLDPSMLEQARQAGQKFEADVGLLARRLLRQTLTPRR